ncbi:MAG: SprB repeat-containing protein, partial [Saprospiraceae bacterium]|nr:SprB repeat-containing protein [Saprospiraceae bacterium]
GNGAPPYEYLWNNGSTNPILPNLCAGTYTAFVVDDDGCTVSETYVLTEPSQLFPGAGSTDETAADANDGTAWAAPSGGAGPYTYHWNNNSTDSLITDLPPGNYTVTVTDANSCSASQTVVVHIFGCTTLDGIVSHNTCFESCDGTITVTLNNAMLPITYQWDNGSTGAVLTGLCIGTYSVTGTDATGCAGFGYFVIEQPLPLNANASNTDETEPDADDGTAWSVPLGGTSPYSYLWSNGSTDSLIVDLAPGVYFLTVTDDNGCTDLDIASISPVLCIGNHTFTYIEPTCHNSCDGSALAMVSDPNNVLSYLWNTGDTTNFLNNLCDGAYSLTITNENLGCTDQSFTFELDPPDS